MAFETQVRTDLFALIETALASVTTIFDAKDVNRLNWRDFIQQFQETGSGGIEPPYVVVAWGRQVPANGKYGAANSAYDWPVSIFIVADAKGDSDTWELALTNLAGALRTALLQSSTIQVAEVSVDYSAESAANAAFLKYGMPLYSAVLDCAIVCGEANL